MLTLMCQIHVLQLHGLPERQQVIYTICLNDIVDECRLIQGELTKINSAVVLCTLSGMVLDRKVRVLSRTP